MRYKESRAMVQMWTVNSGGRSTLISEPAGQRTVGFLRSNQKILRNMGFTGKQDDATPVSIHL